MHVSDRHTQWKTSGADELWEALVYEYQQGTHKNTYLYRIMFLRP